MQATESFRSSAGPTGHYGEGWWGSKVQWNLDWKNKRIKLMWRRVQHHPSLERNSNCIDASYRHKTRTCSQTAAFLLGFSACHEDSDMPAPLVVCIGRLSLVLWFIFIYSIIYIYIYLPWAWYSRVADIDAFTIFPLGKPYNLIDYNIPL